MSRSSKSETRQEPNATGSARAVLPFRKKLLFTVVALVTLMLAIEAAGRVVSWAAYGFNPYYLCYGFYSLTDHEGGGYSSKQRGYYKFPVHATIKYGLPEPCRINNHGLRGHDFETKKAPGTFRVVCMGASSTFGFRDRDEGTYPRLLQRLFDQDGLSPKVEVINAAVPNMRARNIRSMYENEIVDYDADLVTYYEGFNDSHFADETTVQVVSRWLDQHSAAFAGVRKGVNWALGPVLAAWWELPHVDRDEAEKTAQFRADQVAADMGRLIEGAQSRGTQVVLIKQPMTLWFEREARRLVTSESPRSTYEQEYRDVAEQLRTTGRLQGWEVAIYIHHAILDRIPELASRYGLEVVDNIALVAEKPDRLATYVHLTEEANARLAGELHKTIRAAQARRQEGQDQGQR
ncbi:MAG: SGNH/GDSL hydrolase family protein [Planctomycetota bacterium]